MSFNDDSALADLGSCIIRYQRNKHELDIFQLGTEADGFTPAHVIIAGDKSIERLLNLLSTPTTKLRAVTKE